MSKPNLSIDPARLFAKIDRLAEIGRTPEGGCRRLALTQEDKAGRDLVVSWMRDAGLRVQIDQVGNIHGLNWWEYARDLDGDGQISFDEFVVTFHGQTSGTHTLLVDREGRLIVPGMPPP